MKNWQKNIFPVQLKLIAKFYLIAILFFFCFRLLLFFNELNRVSGASLSDILYAFWMGVRFDVVVSSYLLIIPAAVLSVFSIIGKKNLLMEKIFTIVLTLMFFISFLVCGADIPYFQQFFDRFNVGAFDWMQGDGGLSFVVKMIVEEPRYWFMAIPVILVVVIYYFLIKRAFAKTEVWEKGNYVGKSVVTILMLGLMVLGMRGRLDEKSPIRIGTAYFSNNSFLNQLGLNPNFTLLQSYLDRISEKDQEFYFIDDEIALENVKNYLNITSFDENNPIARKITSDTTANNYNVVLVMMESMSANRLQHHGCEKKLTPFLDSLIYKGLYFEHCYTSGTHTYCGIFNSLFSFPTIFRQQPLKQTPIIKYNGMANVLKNNGYSTIYFTTHDSQFDNVGGFLMENDFERVVSKSDYPSKEIKTTLGVPDDFMFRFSIPILNELQEKDKPFFAAFLTASNHGPYYIPEYFNSNFNDVKEQIIEYSDYSIKTFINLAKQQKWFDNTIFAFVADHGCIVDATYSLPESYIHSPLIFYAPNLINDSMMNHNIAGQIDIFPTLMGMLNISHINNTLGIDLLHEKRPYIFATADDKYAVLNEEWMLIVNYNDPQPMHLYHYQEKDRKDYSKERPELAEEMKTYAESNFQITQYLTRTRKQFVR